MAKPSVVSQLENGITPRNDFLDSAHSWVIAFAGTFLQFIVVGSNRANGLLFVAFLDYNQTTREEASWPFTMPVAAVIICAPLTGYLTTFFSVRSVTLFGTLLLSVGSAACYFSTNVYFVSVFFGLVRGAGISMCINSVPGMINAHFQRHRATAMGIATAGDSMGSFVFPLVIQLCLDQYFLKGTFLLLGGMSLHAALGAMLLVPHPATRASNKKLSSNISIEHEGGLSTDSLEKKLDQNQELGEDVQEVTGLTTLLQGDARNIQGGILGDEIDTNRDNSLEIVRGVDKISPDVTLGQSDIDDHLEQVQPLINEPEVKIIIASKREIIKKRKVTFDRKILRNIFTSRGFYLTAVAQVADMFIISNYNVVIVDYVADKGVPYHQGLYMLTVFALGQLVGRLGLGWLTDRKYLSRPVFLFWALNICAALTVLLTFLTDQGVLLLCGAMLGIAGGTLLPVTNVLFSDYLRKEDLDLAVAFSLSFKGIVYMTRIPMIGYFRDQKGSYDHLFHVTAAMLSSAAFVWLFEGIRLRSSRTKQKNQELRHSQDM